MPDDYISAGEAAKLLALTPGRIRQLALAGELKEAFRIGDKRVFSRAAVERFRRTRERRARRVRR